MRRAAALLIGAHPVLRTRFTHSLDGVAYQAILAEDSPAFIEHDIRHLSTEQQHFYLEQHLEHDREALLPPDDGSGGALRFQWVQLAGDSFQLLISIHHAIDDGWGNQYFLTALFDLYQQIKAGDEPAVPRQPNVFKEYVALENAMRGSPQAAAFWAQQPLVPTGRSCLTSIDPSSRARYELNRTIRTGSVERLYATARASGISIKALSLSAYLTLLEQHVVLGAVTVGVVTNGRSEHLSDPLHALGLFWNLVPVGIENGERDVAVHMLAVQEWLLRVERFSAYPFTQVQPTCAADELFFATFNYVNFHNALPRARYPEMSIEHADAHDLFHFPLNCLTVLDKRSGELRASINFAARYFSHGTAQSLMQQYEAEIEARMLAAPRARRS